MYENGRQTQVREHSITETKAIILGMRRDRRITLSQAIAALRDAGCFEAEIREVLGNE